jgi:hypothetical protein
LWLVAVDDEEDIVFVGGKIEVASLERIQGGVVGRTSSEARN